MSRQHASWGQASRTFEQLAAMETDECVVWPFCTGRYGYGQVRIDGRAQLTHTLFRVETGTSSRDVRNQPSTSQHDREWSPLELAAMSVAHTLDVSLGDDQGDGRHLVRVQLDHRTVIHLGLTYEDLVHICDEFGAVERGIYEREEKAS